MNFILGKIFFYYIFPKNIKKMRNSDITKTLWDLKFRKKMPGGVKWLKLTQVKKSNKNV